MILTLRNKLGGCSGGWGGKLVDLLSCLFLLCTSQRRDFQGSIVDVTVLGLVGGVVRIASVLQTASQSVIMRIGRL